MNLKHKIDNPWQSDTVLKQHTIHVNNYFLSTSFCIFLIALVSNKVKGQSAYNAYSLAQFER